MSREKPKKIKVSVGSRIFDTVNLIFLILLPCVLSCLQ